MTRSRVEQDGAVAEVVHPDLIRSTWRQHRDSSHGEVHEHALREVPSHVPRYKGCFPILEAAYNMAMNEVEDNLSPEGLFFRRQLAPCLDARYGFCRASRSGSGRSGA